MINPLSTVYFGDNGKALKVFVKKNQVRCAYGGEVYDMQHRLSTEHLTPKTNGGTDQLKNFIITCFPCNSKRSDTPLKEFLLQTPEAAKNLMQYLLNMKTCVVKNQPYLKKLVPTVAKMLHIPKKHLFNAIEKNDVQYLSKQLDLAA